jgi:hypothetical protein
VIRIVLLLFALTTGPLSWAQDRFKSGELKGFTLGRSEHIMNRVDDPFTVRVVKGSITLQANPGSPAEGVLFELRGPGDSETIVSTTTGRDGTFRLKHVRPGTYMFKATLLGFQSVFGTIVVARKAAADRIITFEMKLGV